MFQFITIVIIKGDLLVKQWKSGLLAPKDMLGMPTGAPKLINSDLFLEKRATVGATPTVARFFQKQITINKFWGTCGMPERKFKL